MKFAPKTFKKKRPDSHLHGRAQRFNNKRVEKGKAEAD